MKLAASLLKVKSPKEYMVLFSRRPCKKLMEYPVNIEDRLAVSERGGDIYL